MNVINETTNLWIAVTKRGSVLCHGNPNDHLSYHVISWWGPFYDIVVWSTRRKGIMEHIKKWNRECKIKDFRCKPVKVAITIKEIKKGESND